MGHTSITLDISGTFSTLTINDVSSDDAGQYCNSCSYANVQIFITLVVIRKHAKADSVVYIITFPATPNILTIPAESIF